LDNKCVQNGQDSETQIVLTIIAVDDNSEAKSK